MATVKALKWFAAKDSVELIDVPRKTAPGPNNIIMRVAYCGVCGTDLHIMAKEFPAAEEVIMGHEFTGVVVEIGSNVTGLHKGDRIMVNPNSECNECRFCKRGKINYCLTGGLRSTQGVYTDGGWTEYVEVAAKRASLLPDGLSLRTAVLCEPLACISNGWNNNGVIPDDAEILVMGAGIIGLLWASLFHHHGYRDVTVTEIIDSRLQLAAGLGLNFKVKHAEQLKAEMAKVNTELDGFDLIIDATGTPTAIEDAFPWLRRGGKLNVFGCCPGKSSMQVNPSFFMMKEVSIIGTLINPFTCYQANRLVSNMAERYLSFEKLGVKMFKLQQYKEAFATLRAGTISKAIFEIAPELDT